MAVSSDGTRQGWAPETWPEYLRRISGGATQAQIAERIGIGRLSVCNWLQGKTQPKAETVINVARAFGRSPVEALVVAAELGTDEVWGDNIFTAMETWERRLAGVLEQSPLPGVACRHCSGTGFLRGGGTDG